MAKPKYPDHAGRMPEHPRYGNPSDPNEELERIAGAMKNLDDWAARNGGSFSGGVSMQYGSGKKYEVPIGDRQIAQKVVSRPLPPKEEAKALTSDILAAKVLNAEINTSATKSAASQPTPKSWLRRLMEFIFGDRI